MEELTKKLVELIGKAQETGPALAEEFMRQFINGHLFAAIVFNAMWIISGISIYILYKKYKHNDENNDDTKNIIMAISSMICIGVFFIGFIAGILEIQILIEPLPCILFRLR